MEVPPVDDIIKRLQSHRGVQGVVVTQMDGTPIRSTLDNTSTLLYLNGVKYLFSIASSMVRDIEPKNRLLYMRIRTKKYELLLNACPEGDYLSLVIQNPNES